MIKKLVVGLGIVVLVLGVSACGSEGKTGETPLTPEQKTELTGIKVLMIIASKDFRDEEYQTPREMLEARGAKVTVASSSLDEAIGMLKKVKVKPDILVADVAVKEYDAVIFVGGVGSNEYFDDKKAHEIVKETLRQNKPLAAICLAPVILAKAGILTDKKATVYESEEKTLKEKGTLYQDEEVVRDGNIITGNGPEASSKFATTIIDALKERKK